MDIEGSEFADLVQTSRSRFEMWVHFIQRSGLRNVAEIGVWKGGFAKAILSGCPSIESYLMVDPWAPLPDWNKPLNVDRETFDAAYAEAMAATEFAAAKRVILRQRTRDACKAIQDESLDFIYVDGDHTLRGIAIDLVCLLPKLKEGGFIAGDDFTPNPWHHDRKYEPTLVFPFAVYFAEAMNLAIKGLTHNQFLIHKDRRKAFAFEDMTTQDYGSLALGSLL